MNRLTVASVVAIIVTALIVGAVFIGHPTLRRNSEGWCVHTAYVMVCNEPEY